jgi:hypothetical protein
MIPLLNRGGLMKGFVQGVDRQQTTLFDDVRVTSALPLIADLREKDLQVQKKVPPTDIRLVLPP